MRIAGEQNLKQCSDGRIKKEYLLSEPFTRETARRMEAFGSVNILEFFPKPLFTLVRKPDMNMRAVLGECTLEIWYEPAILPIAEPEIYTLFEDDPVLVR